MATSTPLELSELHSRVGERILPKWEGGIFYAEEATIQFGRDVKVQSLPDGGYLVTARDQTTPWQYPWKAGLPDPDNRVFVSPGRLNGQIPFISPESRLGEKDVEGDLAKVELSPIESGESWIAVGVNISANEEDDAVLSEEADFFQLRIDEIDELPKGLNSGGVLPNAEGIAYYPLISLLWDDNRVVRMFHIVYHNLNHLVVAGGPQGNQERHFFPPAG